MYFWHERVNARSARDRLQRFSSLDGSFAMYSTTETSRSSERRESGRFSMLSNEDNSCQNPRLSQPRDRVTGADTTRAGRTCGHTCDQTGFLTLLKINTELRDPPYSRQIKRGYTRDVQSWAHLASRISHLMRFVMIKFKSRSGSHEAGN